jgi:hypothetical protein
MSVVTRPNYGDVIGYAAGVEVKFTDEMERFIDDLISSVNGLEVQSSNNNVSGFTDIIQAQDDKIRELEAVIYGR